MPELFTYEDVLNASDHLIMGVVHIGAHYGEEAKEYREYNWPVTWFEGHPEYATKLKDKLKDYVRQDSYEALLSDVDDEEVSFWVTKDEFASSILKPEIHQLRFPHAQISHQVQLRTKRYDTFVEEQNLPQLNYHLLVLDVQGSELNVWNGMGKYQDCFNVIISEYSTVEYYKDGPRLHDLDNAYKGFKRVYPKDSDIREHGDSLYVREILPNLEEVK
jgi:FkbM family methyltransferase